MTELNLEERKLEIQFSRHGSRSPDNADVVVLQRTAKKCTKTYNARTQHLFCH